MSSVNNQKEKNISARDENELKEKDLISLLGKKNYQNSGVDVTLSLRPPGEQLKSCTMCGTTNTPVWRRGPDGSTTACNSCGIKFWRAQEKLDTSLCLSPAKKQRK